MSSRGYLPRIAAHICLQLGYYPTERQVLIVGVDERERMVGIYAPTYLTDAHTSAFDIAPELVVERLERQGAHRFVVMGLGPDGQRRARDATLEVDLHRNQTGPRTITIAVEAGAVRALNSRGQWTKPAALFDFQAEAAAVGIDLTTQAGRDARYTPDPIPSWSPLPQPERSALDALDPTTRGRRATQLILDCTADGNAGTAEQRATLGHLIHSNGDHLELVAAYAALSPDRAAVLYNAYMTSPPEYRGALGAAAGYAHLVAEGTTFGAIRMSQPDAPTARARALTTTTITLCRSTATAAEMRETALTASRLLLDPKVLVDDSIQNINNMLDRAAPVRAPLQNHNTVGDWKLRTHHDNQRDIGQLSMGILEP